MRELEEQLEYLKGTISILEEIVQERLDKAAESESCQHTIVNYTLINNKSILVCQSCLEPIVCKHLNTYPQTRQNQTRYVCTRCGSFADFEPCKHENVSHDSYLSTLRLICDDCNEEVPLSPVQEEFVLCKEEIILLRHVLNLSTSTSKDVAAIRNKFNAYNFRFGGTKLRSTYEKHERL